MAKMLHLCQMFNPVLFYCYDAYCGWCYGFSDVMKQVDAQFSKYMPIEVLSGGMILPEKPVHIGATAAYIESAYRTVEEHTGVKFGDDYLWHINNPDDSDWYPNSEKPAIALCILKEYYPEKQVSFAADMQYALHFEGRDLTDNESYRHLVEKYGINEEAFFTKLESDEYKEKAYYEFALCKQLQVKGFPCVLLQTGESKFYLITSGYANFETINTRLMNVLKDTIGK